MIHQTHQFNYLLENYKTSTLYKWKKSDLKINLIGFVLFEDKRYKISYDKIMKIKGKEAAEAV